MTYTTVFTDMTLEATYRTRNGKLSGIPKTNHYEKHMQSMALIQNWELKIPHKQTTNTEAHRLNCITSLLVLKH